MNNEQFQRLYAVQLEEAQQYQDFIVRLLLKERGIFLQQMRSRAAQYGVGETVSGYEIKYDKKYQATGNLWIEVAEKASLRGGPYAKSGLYRDDNSFMWVIGDYHNVFCVQKTLLLAEARSPNTQIVENNTKTSEGFLMRGSRARQLSAFVLYPTREDKSLVNEKLADELMRDAAEMRRVLLANPRQRQLID